MEKVKRSVFKIKVAIFFGYNGKKYHGLQKAPNFPTIEEAMEKALFDAEFITQSNYGDLKKIGWGRGSRTDKGVHASINVINCKLSVSDKYVDKENEGDEITKKDLKKLLNRSKIVNELNGHLPEDIKAFAVKLVTQGFNCKNSARSRKYEYFMPVSVLRTEDNKDMTKEELLKKFDKLLQMFIGTHNFHNYTKKGDYKDGKMNRHMIELGCSYYQPKDYPDKEYILVRLHGQSFIYNQIRKMMGMIMFVFRNDLDEVYVENSFGSNVYNVWLAPGEGLTLDRMFFTGYNYKTDIPEKLVVTESEEELVQKFKENTIYKQILTASEEDKVFETWLEKVEADYS